MPRLLIVCEYPTLLGGERSMLATLPAVAAAGFEISVAAPAAGPLAHELRRRGIPHWDWPTKDDAGQRLPLEDLRGSLSRLLREVRPDLVHANSLSTARIAGPPAASAGIRSIGHLRDIVKLARQAVDDLNLHTRLIAVSAATREFHVAQGLDSQKCVVSRNGVDLDAFAPRSPTGYLHRELGLPASARFVAVIGQIGLRKGIDVALRAALQAAADLPDVRWLIVGERTSDKDESRQLELDVRSLAAEPALAGRVHCLGSRSDVPTLMNECALLVHAARQEPLGRVLLEAAASGLPAIATDVGGTREIFPAETDGAVLVPVDAPGEIVEGLKALLLDESRRRELAAAARRRAERAFGIDLASRELIRHYQQLIGKRIG